MLKVFRCASRQEMLICTYWSEVLDWLPWHFVQTLCRIPRGWILMTLVIAQRGRQSSLSSNNEALGFPTCQKLTLWDCEDRSAESAFDELRMWLRKSTFLTNGTFKETGAKTQQRAAAVDSMKLPMCFFSIKACKPIQVVAQNKTEYENEHSVSSLICHTSVV